MDNNDTIKIEGEVVTNKDKYASARKKRLIMMCISLVLGVALLLWPETFQAILVQIVASALILCGLLEFLFFLRIKTDKNLGHYVSFTGGIALVLLGLFGVIFPDIVLGSMYIVFGIIILFLGIIDFSNCIQYAKGSLIAYILSGIEILLGILAMWNPFGIPNLITRIIGAIFIYNAVVGFIMFFSIKKTAKKAVDVEYHDVKEPEESDT